MSAFLIPSILVASGSTGALVAAVRAFVESRKNSDTQVTFSKGDHRIQLNAESVSDEEIFKIVKAILKIDQEFDHAKRPADGDKS